MNLERAPGEQDPSFEEYKQRNERILSADKLSHYFNNELGTASNLVMTLRARLQSLVLSPDILSAMLLKMDEIVASLKTVHEIGNVAIDLLEEKSRDA